MRLLGPDDGGGAEVAAVAFVVPLFVGAVVVAVAVGLFCPSRVLTSTGCSLKKRVEHYVDDSSKNMKIRVFYRRS